jgi:Fic family protein
MDCMGALENTIHGKLQELPVLIRMALVHAQFEFIHPFLDGNGRLGRLLITLQLCAESVLDSPMLYLSLYFKKRRDDYYSLLQQIRTDGDWEQWLLFFMNGVKETADLAVHAAKCLTDLFERDREAIQSIGKAAGSALRVQHALQKNPISSIQKLAKVTGLTIPTTTLALEKLYNLGIVKELTGLKRGRLFAYRKYISVLSEGTEPL